MSNEYINKKIKNLGALSQQPDFTRLLLWLYHSALAVLLEDVTGLMSEILR